MSEPADGLPRQASLNRLQRFDIRPNRELGQNFLIDDNLLGVIGAGAELGSADVVLEVGGGLGVLSEYLAERVAHLHVVEIDRSLKAALRDALDPHPNVTLHFADAVALDLSSLDPTPTKVVANLPYGVAATVLLKTVFDLAGATLWLAMVQREVGERLRPRPEARSTARRRCSPRSPATCASCVACRRPCSIRVPTSSRPWSCCDATGRPRRPRPSPSCTRRSPTGARP